MPRRAISAAAQAKVNRMAQLRPSWAPATCCQHAAEYERLEDELEAEIGFERLDMYLEDARAAGLPPLTSPAVSAVADTSVTTRPLDESPPTAFEQEVMQASARETLVNSERELGEELDEPGVALAGGTLNERRFRFENCTRPRGTAPPVGLGPEVQVYRFSFRKPPRATLKGSNKRKKVAECVGKPGRLICTIEEAVERASLYFLLDSFFRLNGNNALRQVYSHSWNVELKGQLFAGPFDGCDWMGGRSCTDQTPVPLAGLKLKVGDTGVFRYSGAGGEAEMCFTLEAIGLAADVQQGTEFPRLVRAVRPKKKTVSKKRVKTIIDSIHSCETPVASGSGGGGGAATV